MGALRAKIQEAENDRLFNERRDMRRKQIGSGDRSEKIRTYNFPQDRLTDHRINFNAHNLPKIMEGNMEELYNELEARELALFEEGATS